MKKLIAGFPAQLIEALEIGAAANIRKSEKPIHKAYVAGMGGSGIGADFVASFIRDESPIPYHTGKGYDIPAWVDENTLAIASSYSGNTEETLSAFQQFQERGAKIVCLASAGKLVESAKANGLDYIQLPAGSPSPRACLGYSLVQQLWILNKLGIIGSSLLDQIRGASDFLTKHQESIQERAKQIAALIHDRVPIIYTLDRFEPVAVRMRQQFNENGKMLCWHHVIPEMNHNELVGWREEDSRLAVLFLRSSLESHRNQTRTEITKEVVGNFAGSVLEIQAKGDNLVEQSLYLVHLADWLSAYLADERGFDAIEIKVIDFLKESLARQ
ncbi:MAG: bifunctional phosphoglucose/phosphomannose isomerase [Saprospiraceae bacterium]|nr:bifunctional phosphoglucose/phosphomannose isomerase [Saprospiraceae bacterium]